MEDLQKFIEDTMGLMLHYHQNSNGPDYRCEYCEAEPRGSQWIDIEHRPNCSGVKLLAFLQSLEVEND